MMKVKYYTCPVCKKKFKTLNGWGEHLDRIHPNERPDGYSISRYFYYTKTGRTHGTCRTCKGKTPWIESSMKYAQFCENPKCKEAYVKIAKTRMINKYGKPHLLNDPDVQKKMLSHRHITGYYKFQDGGTIEHVGSYEKNFLMMLDTLLQWPSNDIISPSPHIYYYDYENEVDADNNGRKFYIPDYYIPSLNLEIEIKQQTSTNQAFNEVNRVKERMKDEIMKNNKQVNYLKINDNDFREFFQLLEDMKDQDPVEAEKAATESYQLEDIRSTPALEAYKSYPSPYKIEKRWFIKSRNGETHSLVMVKGNPRKLRYRAEMLVVKGDRVFLNFRKKGGISLPGGGLEPDEDPKESAIRETQEEIRVNVKNAKYVGSIVGSYNHIPAWMKLTVKKEDQWTGYYTLCFIGTYESDYTGKVKLKDQDSLYRTGKFRKISDVYSLLDPIYQEALDKYYGNQIAKESYSEESELNPACECFGNCNRLNIEKKDCIGCENYLNTTEDSKDIEVFIAIQHKNQHSLEKKDDVRVSISFNPEFKDYYTFGDHPICTLGAPIVVTSPDQNIENHIYPFYKIYSYKVTEKEYIMMRQRAEWWISQLDSYVRVRGINPSENIKNLYSMRMTLDILNVIRKDHPIVILKNFLNSNQVSLVDQGKDFRKYRPAKPTTVDDIQPTKESVITCDNIPKLDTSGEVELLPATEGIFQLFHKREKTENDVTSWKDKLFGGKGLFGNKFGTFFHGIKIKNHMIEFHGITVSTLKNRINKFYGDKSIYNIFIPEYNAFDYRKFKKKKISRSKMRIDYLYTHEFFALELVCLFRDLGKRFNDKNYLSFATSLYENSWLASADNKAEVTPLLSTKRLENLTLTLNDYQKDFIEKYPKLKAQLNLKGYILAFEQGLGKTLTAIALSECLEVDHVYIVCPNSLKENWALEIRKYYQKYEDEDLWKQEVFICSNKSIFFNRNTTRFVITNNESIEKMFPYVMPGKNMLILDESHNFRNIESKRVAQLIQLRDQLECVDTLIMSGTPIKATPDEIVPALMMIDPTFNTDAARIFSKAFKLKSSFGTSLVQSRFGKIMYRKEKDVLEGKLPQKFIHYLSLSTHDKDRYHMKNVNEVVGKRFSEIFNSGYEEFRKLEKPFLEMAKRYTIGDMNFNQFKYIMTEVVKRNNKVHELDMDYAEEYIKKVRANIKDKQTRDQWDYLVKNYVRYQAHCLGLAFGEILPVYRRNMFISLYEDNKRIIHEMIESNVKKTLIFSQFKGVTNHIHTALNNSGIKAVLITGDVKDRMSVLKSFKEDDTVRVLVATSQTIGTGVTLVEANQMFFFGPPWRDGDFQQCSDRIHRIGQTDDCNIYTVILDTSGELNLSTRMDNILSWSKQMTDSVIVKTEDDQDIDENHFEELLTASESSLIPEFLSKPEENQFELRHPLHGKSFYDVACESNRNNYYRTYEASSYIPENTVIINDMSSREAKQLVENVSQHITNKVSNLRIDQVIQNGNKKSCIVTTKDIYPGNLLSLK